MNSACETQIASWQFVSYKKYMKKKNVEIGKDVIIGHNVKIEDNVKIFGECLIGDDVTITSGSRLSKSEAKRS